MSTQNGGSGFLELCGEGLVLSEGARLLIGDVCADVGLGSGGSLARSVVSMLSPTLVNFFFGVVHDSST